MHPNYNQGHAFNNDLALLRLGRRAYTDSPSIGVVCMPTMHLTSGRQCTATGWGVTSESKDWSRRVSLKSALLWFTMDDPSN
jgi:hypothetical protein